MAITFDNVGSQNNELHWFGEETIAKGASSYINFAGYEGAVSVGINGTATADFMVYTSISLMDSMLDESAVYIPAATTDIDANKDYPVFKGVTGLKITNRATSTDTITVAWRFLR